MLLSTRDEYRVDDITRLIMFAMDDETLYAYMLTNKYNLSLLHDQLFWNSKINHRGLVNLLQFTNYYRSLGHLYLRIQNDYCYIVRYTMEKVDHRYYCAGSYCASSIEGAINYFSSQRNQTRYEIAIVFKAERRIPPCVVFTSFQLLNPASSIDFTLYPLSKLRGFILNEANNNIIPVNNDTVEILRNVQITDDPLCLAWIDHKPKYNRHRGDLQTVREAEHVENYYNV